MSAFLIGLYLTGGVSYVVAPPALPMGGLRSHDLNNVANPYGVVAAGWSTKPDRPLSFTVECRHMSSLPARDYGTNSIEARVTWRPFK